MRKDRQQLIFIAAAATALGAISCLKFVVMSDQFCLSLVTAGGWRQAASGQLTKLERLEQLNLHWPKCDMMC